MKPLKPEPAGGPNLLLSGPAHRRTHRPMHEAPPIVFFDAGCGLCTGLVRLLGRANKDGRVRFEPLSGGVARRLLQPRQLARDTLWLRENGRLRGRSTAVLRLMWLLGWPWNLAAPLLLVPRPLRDRVYEAVARRRRGNTLPRARSS